MAQVTGNRISLRMYDLNTGVHLLVQVTAWMPHVSVPLYDDTNDFEQVHSLATLRCTIRKGGCVGQKDGQKSKYVKLVKLVKPAVTRKGTPLPVHTQREDFVKLNPHTNRKKRQQTVNFRIQTSPRGLFLSAQSTQMLGSLYGG